MSSTPTRAAEAASSAPTETHDILRRVVSLTREGRLAWDTTGFSISEIYVSLASGGISLDMSSEPTSPYPKPRSYPRPRQKDISYPSYTRLQQKDIAVNIRNEDGISIYAFRVEPSDPLYSGLEQTYYSARRQALGAPDTLRKMREELAAR